MDASQTDNENTQTQTNSGNENTSTQTDGNNQELINKGIDIGFAKGADKATKELLQNLGFDNVDDLSSAISKHKEFEESRKTELEKLTEKNTAYENQVKTLQDEISNLKQENEISSIASKHGIKEIDYFKYEYGRAKEQEDFNMDSFVSSLLESKGHLLGVDKSVNIPNPSSSNNQKGAVRRADFDKMSPLDKQKLISSGAKIID